METTACKLRSTKEDRLRIQHERLENERRYNARKFDSDLVRVDNFPERVSEETKLRKQRERLENEKKYYKRNSHLTNDRRLSVQAEGQTSKSSHQRPDMSNVKSKLFDYQRSAPRSRRQLALETEPPSRSPLSRNSPQRAIDANNVPSCELVHHLALASDLAKDRQRSVSRLNDQNEARPTKKDLALAQTALEREASSRNISSREHSVSFDDGAPPPSHHGKSRASSLPGPAIKVASADPDDDQAMQLQALYDRAIETVQKADESMLLERASKATHPKDRRASLPARSNTDLRNKSGLDVTALKELESILKDARLYTSRKSSKEDHCRLDLGSNRAQKKRIQHLEKVLKQLNPNFGATQEEMDPMKVLQCSYLRLSISNVETLEGMLRDAGRDPGIHIHSDVSNCDIWRGLQQERVDLKPEQKESKKSATSKKSLKV